MEEYEPIYNPGDYWLRSSGTTGTGSFTALSYYNSTEDRESINTLDVTMPDLYTPRGIRVGASREDVLTAYPEAVSEDYWGKYPGQDYLWYCRDSNDFGPAILFFFNGDTLHQITLTNMFD